MTLEFKTMSAGEIDAFLADTRHAVTKSKEPLPFGYHETGEEAERYLRETSLPDSVMLVVSPQKVLSGNYN
jgi:hypothetical protein